MVAEDLSPAMLAVRTTGSSEVRSMATFTLTRPVDSSTTTTGRTVANRAVLQACRDTGFQMPTDAASNPQSQPKLQAALRMALKGWV